ncbi:MAG TPA: CBS domain-containing protein, partial [Thermoanaerobaculia bacterium]|nr:CBS domain-containing protein [Thermoanaerobaculia bacterium]
IMTEKLARRGVRVPAEYAADYLDGISVSAVCATDVVTLRADQTVDEARAIVATHQGFPVVDEHERLIGVVTRRDFLAAEAGTVRSLVTKPPAVIFPDSSLRDAADQMVRHNVGRLPVVAREEPTRVVGFLTRSDLLSAHAQRLTEERA